MSQKYKVDFATFCHKGDAHRLHAPGQLKKQVESNGYDFNKVIVIYQECNPLDYPPLDYPAESAVIISVDNVLSNLGVDISKPQYTSNTDKAHIWKYHVVNHLAAVHRSQSDYIVFADNDCWMVRQPEGQSWITRGIEILQNAINTVGGKRDIFIVSPNDGEPERVTRRMSQQMFLARTDEFRNADFNQPGWDGNVNIPGGPMPEYWGMLEGRIELYCRATGLFRFVLGPEYRYWHFNRLGTDGLFETDMSKY